MTKEQLQQIREELERKQRVSHLRAESWDGTPELKGHAEYNFGRAEAFAIALKLLEVPK